MKTFEIRINTFSKATHLQSALSKIAGAIDLLQDQYVVNAKSLLGIFSLDLNRPVTLRVREEADEEKVAGAIIDYIV